MFTDIDATFFVARVDAAFASGLEGWISALAAMAATSRAAQILNLRAVLPLDAPFMFPPRFVCVGSTHERATSSMVKCSCVDNVDFLSPDAIFLSGTLQHWARLADRRCLAFPKCSLG
jgi:hypothetical protein